MSMLVKQAKAVARQWVLAEGRHLLGFLGACYAGSTNWLPDDAALPATSDLDVKLVVADPSAASKRGKFVYQDVLLEVSYLSPELLRSPERMARMVAAAKRLVEESRGATDRALAEIEARLAPQTRSE